MDYFKLVFFLIIYLIFFNTAQATIPNTGYSVVQAGPTTTYTVTSTPVASSYVPVPTAPTGTGLSVINSNTSVLSNGTAASGAKYVQGQNIPVGVTIAGINVSSSVSQTSIATSVLTLAKNPTTFGLVMATGQVLASLFTNSKVSNANNGSVQYDTQHPTSSACNTLANARIAQFSLDPSYYHAGILTYPNFSNLGVTGYQCVILTGGGAYYQAASQVACANSQCTINTAQGVSDAMPTTSTNNINISDADALTKIKAAMSPSVAPLVAELAKITTADYSPIPDLTIPTVTLPSPANFSQGLPKSNVTPTGVVQTTTESYNMTQPNSNSFAISDVTTVSTVPAGGGTAQVSTASNAPAVLGSTSTPVASNSPTDCDKYPNSIGCSNFGSSTPSDVIPVVNVPITLMPTSLGSGSCPAPIAFNLNWGGPQVISWTPICDLATGVNPLIIAMGWLMAGYMVIGSVKA
jgi:hypothetical protein